MPRGRESVLGARGRSSRYALVGARSRAACSATSRASLPRNRSAAPRAKRQASGNVAPPSPLPPQPTPKDPLLGSSSDTSAGAGEDDALDAHFAHALLDGCVRTAACTSLRGRSGGARRGYAARGAQRPWVGVRFRLTRARALPLRSVAACDPDSHPLLCGVDGDLGGDFGFHNDKARRAGLMRCIALR